MLYYELVTPSNQISLPNQLAWALSGYQWQAHEKSYNNNKMSTANYNSCEHQIYVLASIVTL